MLKEPRREIIGIRLTQEEKKEIINVCRSLGYDTLSECIRKKILELITSKTN